MRYQHDDIYTYTGSILIAVNPFATMPHLYGKRRAGAGFFWGEGARLGRVQPGSTRCLHRRAVLVAAL